MNTILYSIGCPNCNILKNMLKKNNIEFIEENDVEHMLSIGVNAVPVLEVDGVRMDYNEAKKWIIEGEIK